MTHTPHVKYLSLYAGHDLGGGCRPQLEQLDRITTLTVVGKGADLFLRNVCEACTASLFIIFSSDFWRICANSRRWTRNLFLTVAKAYICRAMATFVRTINGSVFPCTGSPCGSYYRIGAGQNCGEPYLTKRQQKRWVLAQTPTSLWRQRETGTPHWHRCGGPGSR